MPPWNKQIGNLDPVLSVAGPHWDLINVNMVRLIMLTPEQLGTIDCALSTVSTDVLVLTHHATSAEWVITVLDWLSADISIIRWTTLKMIIIFWKYVLVSNGLIGKSCTRVVSLQRQCIFLKQVRGSICHQLVYNAVPLTEKLNLVGSWCLTQPVRVISW